MAYNWQHKNWPNFEFDANSTLQLDYKLMELIGQSIGTQSVLSNSINKEMIIDHLVIEALKTSEIEGEYLNKNDLISSIKRNMGYDTPSYFIKDKRAEGIAKLMVLGKETYNEELSHEMLFEWHKLLMQGSSGFAIGCYRNHLEPMQVISGPMGKEKIHFEAPPSSEIKKEMDQFIAWYNKGKEKKVSPILFSAITHLYFESIHPFEDGNGRIGRVLAEKALCQSVDRPLLISMSSIISENKGLYYEALKIGQSKLEISHWISYFGMMIIMALEKSNLQIRFLIEKSKFYTTIKMNERQLKVVTRMLEAGIEFIGGMNARKYVSIAGTSKATATRDLQDLVERNIIISKGAGRSTNYQVNLQIEND